MDTTKLWLGIEGKLRAYLEKRVHDSAVVDDILQDSYLRLHERIDQLEDISRADGWLFRIAQNLMYDHFKKNPGTKPTTDLLSEQIPVRPSKSEGPTEQLAGWIPTAIELLPEKYRQAVYLTEIEGLSQKELAQRLGLSYSAAKSRVQRGRAKLKDIILECCEVAADRYGNVIEYHSRQKS